MPPSFLEIMLRNSTYLIALTFSLVLQAYAQDPAMIDRVDRLENKLMAMESTHHPPQAVQLSHETINNNPHNDPSLHSRLLELEEKMRDLNGKYESSQHEIKILTDKLQNLASDVEMRFKMNQASSTATTPSDGKDNTVAPAAMSATTPSQPTSATTTQTSEEKLLDQLTDYNEMIGKGEYTKAAAQLEKFVIAHKNHEIAGEAYYLLGNAYSKQKQNDKAAVSYLKSYKNYPGNNKAPDSLLRLSYSLNQLGKKAKACEMLQKLDQEYPGRSETNQQKTKEAKLKFQCKAQ